MKTRNASLRTAATASALKPACKVGIEKVLKNRSKKTLKTPLPLVLKGL